MGEDKWERKETAEGEERGTGAKKKKGNRDGEGERLYR